MSQARPPGAPAGDPIEGLGSVGVIPVVVIDDAAKAAIEIMAEYPDSLQARHTA
jgi:hypothetical protein